MSVFHLSSGRYSSLPGNTVPQCQLYLDTVEYVSFPTLFLNILITTRQPNQQWHCWLYLDRICQSASTLLADLYSSLSGNPVSQCRLYLDRICQSYSTLLADIHQTEPQCRLYLNKICQSSTILMADIHHFKATQCRIAGFI
jgi:hypothetical protein